MFLCSLIIIMGCSSSSQKDEITCDCEQHDSANFIGKCRGERFESANFLNLTTRTNKYSRSGKYAIRIDKENPYGLTYTIKEVKPKEHYRISCWRHKVSSGESSIVLSAENTDDLYFAQSESIKESKGDWELLVLDVIIPEKAKNKDIKTYLYSKEGVAFYDDFKIEYISKILAESKNPKSSFIDPRDGNNYRTVKIGDDWWMAENLRYSGCKQCCSYNNNIENNLKYGVLYDFDNAKKSAPIGWRLPSDEDWRTLEQSIGLSTKQSEVEGNRGYNKSYILKEYGNSGFEVKSAGAYAGGYYNLEQSAYFWTSTEIDSANAYCREISHWASIGKFKDLKSMRFSIRCIKEK